MRKLCLIIVTLLAAVMPTFGQNLPTNLRTSFLRPGLRLELGLQAGNIGLPEEGFELLRLKGIGVYKPLKVLGDLQGAVTIDSPWKALDYVRLLTSFSFWFVWHQDDVLEVSDVHEAKGMSDYGFDIDAPWHYSSGFMGIMSEKTAKGSGLSMAHIKREGDGYVVTRWLLQRTHPGSILDYNILYVEERVGQDGSYHRTVLKKRRVPLLSGTLWSIPTFE